MKRILRNMQIILLGAISISLISCQDQEVEPQDDLINNSQAIREFGNVISSNAEPITRYVNSYFQGTYQANTDKEELTEEEAKQILNSMLEPSKEFLFATGYTEKELLDEFNSLEGPEIFLTAITTLGKLEFDKDDGQSIKNPGYDNSFLKCLGSASGIKGLWDLATGAATASRATILKTVGKVARRSFGWIGAALFIGEFVQCYWGNNSSFD